MLVMGGNDKVPWWKIIEEPHSWLNLDFSRSPLNTPDLKMFLYYL